MIVKTSRFGDKDVPDDALIVFPEGIPAFRDAHRFVMFECTDDGLFKWLQSADRPDLAFVVAEATALFPDYRVVLSDKECKTLGLGHPDDAVVCLILIIPADPMEATANMMGPLVFNVKTRLGMQVLLVNPEYSTRQRLFAPADPKEASASASVPARTRAKVPAPAAGPRSDADPATTASASASGTDADADVEKED